METVLLIVSIGIICVIAVVLVIRLVGNKSKKSPSPRPMPAPPYTGFLSTVELVIKNNLSEDQLKSYFATIKSEFDMYYEKYDGSYGFSLDFNNLLRKYNIPYPY